MNRNDLVTALAIETGLSTDEAAQIVEVLLNSIIDILIEKGSVTIPGFGEFTIKSRPARTARDPRTGNIMTLPERSTVAFKAVSELKRRVQTTMEKPKSRSRSASRKIAGSALRRSLQKGGRQASRGYKASARPMLADHDASARNKGRMGMVIAPPGDEVLIPDHEPATTPLERYFQASVGLNAGGRADITSALQPGTDYEARVFIGARKKGWLGLTEPMDEPAPKPDGSPNKLHVVFWEPDLCPKPQICALDLWPVGDTEVCRFPFRTRDGKSVLCARISVYHGNRNLQTGLLQGDIGGQKELTFTLDAAPLPGFHSLEFSNDVSASIILNGDRQGRMHACIYRDGQAHAGELGEPLGASAKEEILNIKVAQEDSLRQFIKTLGRQITNITNAPEEFDDLGKEGTRQLLVEFAQRGAGLHRLLSKTMMGDKLKDAHYIQVVRAHADAFYPVEFQYEGEAPETGATICDGSEDAGSARKALAEGKCCGACDKDPYNTVCPLKFWSLSKVIERHAHLPEHTLMSGQFQLHRSVPCERTPILKPLQGVVLAASERVDDSVPETVENLRKNLSEILGGAEVPVAANWSEWQEHIQDTLPHLLIMLPHHVNDHGHDALEIGGDSRRTLLIRPFHVHPIGNDDLAPVVLLIGCDTNWARINWESSVSEFQDHGAAIVVGTVGSILGRQAGPVAGVLVEEMRNAIVAAKEQNRLTSFGEVMLTARRRLLAEGVPMVFGLASFGDADWVISGEVPQHANN